MAWLKERLSLILVIGVVVAGVLVIVVKSADWMASEGDVDITVPVLSDVAQRGQTLFETNCATCHGVNAAGGQGGPPLIHKIYNPGHHGDVAFLMAVRRGVRQHHWRFGNMPPQRQVSDVQVADIVRFVRELQVANGIR